MPQSKRTIFGALISFAGFALLLACCQGADEISPVAFELVFFGGVAVLMIAWGGFLL
jgi:hypothetical protein